MVTIAEREGKGRAREAEKDLRAREDKCRAGSPSAPQDGRPALRQAQGPDNMDAEPIEAITEEQRQRNLTRVGDIIKTIGG